MKAVVYAEFGDSSVLAIDEVTKPVPKENEVLIKAAATSVNPFELKIRRGDLQKQVPVQFPYVPGCDVAGTVEAVGKNVRRIKVGDEVFGTAFGGTYAEYVVLKEEAVAVQPKNISAGEAASLAVPLATAYTFLVENGQVKAGQKILIHGISGGVGAVVLQTAKALGAYVIGTATGKGLQLAKTYGADEVIDYKNQDFSASVREVDLVVDFVGGETLAKSYGVVKKGGLLLSAVMPPSQEQAATHGITAKFISSEPSYKKLEFGRSLVEKGQVKSNIVKTLPLSEAAQAQDLVSAGGVDGKVVLEID